MISRYSFKLIICCIFLASVTDGSSRGYEVGYNNYITAPTGKDGKPLKQKNEFKSSKNIVELKISAKDLPSKKLNTEPTTMVETRLIEHFGTPWENSIYLKPTECITENASPSWPEYLQFKFNLHSPYYIHAAVYHCEKVVNPRTNYVSYKRTKDKVGEVTLSFAVLLKNQGMEITRNLLKGDRIVVQEDSQNPAMLTITAYELPEPRTLVVYFEMSVVVWGNAKDDQDSEYELEIADKYTNSDEVYVIYISERQKKTNTKPFLSWKKVMLPMSRFYTQLHDHEKKTKGMKYRLTTFTLYRVKGRTNSSSSKTSRNAISSFTQDFSKILFAFDEHGGVKFEMDNGFMMQQTITRDQLTFPRLIYDGMKMKTVVAIDFTRSNVAQGLHKGDEVTEYEIAIESALKILMEYDSTNQYITYAFGIQEQFEEVSHCYPIKDPKSDADECEGVKGVIDGYKKLLNKCALDARNYTDPNFSQFQRYNFKLSSPTHFNNIIRETIIKARRDNEARRGHVTYYVILMVTDGQVDDQKETVAEIVKASFLPISVVIVGVGNPEFINKEWNFGFMKQLRSDKQLLSDHNGRVAQRDIVQFVKFNEYYDPKRPHDLGRLSNAILEKIPFQIASYFFENQIFHNRAPPPRLARDLKKRSSGSSSSKRHHHSSKHSSSQIKKSPPVTKPTVHHPHKTSHEQDIPKTSVYVKSSSPADSNVAKYSRSSLPPPQKMRTTHAVRQNTPIVQQVPSRESHYDHYAKDRNDAPISRNYNDNNAKNSQLPSSHQVKSGTSHPETGKRKLVSNSDRISYDDQLTKTKATHYEDLKNSTNSSPRITKPISQDSSPRITKPYPQNSPPGITKPISQNSSPRITKPNTSHPSRANNTQHHATTRLNTCHSKMNATARANTQHPSNAKVAEIPPFDSKKVNTLPPETSAVIYHHRQTVSLDDLLPANNKLDRSRKNLNNTKDWRGRPANKLPTDPQSTSPARRTNHGRSLSLERLPAEVRSTMKESENRNDIKRESREKDLRLDSKKPIVSERNYVYDDENSEIVRKEIENLKEFAAKDLDFKKGILEGKERRINIRTSGNSKDNYENSKGSSAKDVKYSRDKDSGIIDTISSAMKGIKDIVCNKKTHSGGKECPHCAKGKRSPVEGGEKKSANASKQEKKVRVKIITIETDVDDEKPNEKVDSSGRNYQSAHDCSKSDAAKTKRSDGSPKSHHRR